MKPFIFYRNDGGRPCFVIICPRCVNFWFIERAHEIELHCARHVCSVKAEAINSLAEEFKRIAGVRE